MVDIENIIVNITVNGIKHTLNIDKKETLLEILRDRLELTGTKLGCGYGKCGACTVVMNGEAVESCKIRGGKINGASIITIEGLSDKNGLHPIQRAFIETDAVQCGFCTPGFIMRLYALFNKKKNATIDEIKEVLSHHLCRCTGYESIIKAAILAQEKINSNT